MDKITEFFANVKSEYDLLDYMDKHIKYGFVGKNNKIYTDQNSKEFRNDWYTEYTLQSGESLIENHYGTCWDHVELERLWFEKNNFVFKTIFTWFEINKPNNLPTHSFLIYNKNNMWYLFEHNIERGILEFQFEKEAIDYIKQKQLEFAINDKKAKPSDQVFLKSYEYSKPVYNIGVDEYLEHVTNNLYIKSNYIKN